MVSRWDYLLHIHVFGAYGNLCGAKNQWGLDSMSMQWTFFNIKLAVCEDSKMKLNEVTWYRERNYPSLPRTLKNWLCCPIKNIISKKMGIKFGIYGRMFWKWVGGGDIFKNYRYWVLGNCAEQMRGNYIEVYFIFIVSGNPCFLPKKKKK